MANYTDEFLKTAHKSSIRHKKEILESNLCGCFCCCLTFPPTEIDQWVKDGKEETDETAICPKCNIDSVLGNRFPVSDESFLIEMEKMWFGIRKN